MLAKHSRIFSIGDIVISGYMWLGGNWKGRLWNDIDMKNAYRILLTGDNAVLVELESRRATAGFR